MPVLYKARYLVPFLDAARGAALFAPVKLIENGAILVRDGKIAAYGSSLSVQPHCEIRDLGDAVLLPPLVNAHTHLQLSWLAGATLWNAGFVPWLKSLVKQIFAPITESERNAAIAAAFDSLDACGTDKVGDIGGSIPGSATQIAGEAARRDIKIAHFCEWIGFDSPYDSPWPLRCRGEIDALGGIDAAPAGHALYSTSAAIMRMAHAFCVTRGKKFCFHLAESEDETELLTTGKGEMADFYRTCLFPENWRAPGLAPFFYAQKLGLLGPETLAVHGVTLSSGELVQLAASGAKLCICARSNHNLGVGTPPLKQAIAAGVLLCIGTDGLTSCQDLDLTAEMKYLRERMDIPPAAIWRMATANGFMALGGSREQASLRVGAPARFGVWKNCGGSHV